MKNILITGGAGFIGSNFVKLMLDTHDYNIINLDLLTYAGNLENLKEVEINLITLLSKVIFVISNL